MVEWIKMSLGTEVGLGPGDIVLHVDPAPPPTEKGHSTPHFSAHIYFGPCLWWSNGRPSQQLLSSCYKYSVKKPSLVLQVIRISGILLINDYTGLHVDLHCRFVYSRVALLQRPTKERLHICANVGILKGKR